MTHITAYDVELSITLLMCITGILVMILVALGLIYSELTNKDRS